MTNGDRIRAMTDEELAEYLDGFSMCEEIGSCPDLMCDECKIAWLQREATDD